MMARELASQARAAREECGDCLRSILADGDLPIVILPEDVDLATWAAPASTPPEARKPSPALVHRPRAIPKVEREVEREIDAEIDAELSARRHTQHRLLTLPRFYWSAGSSTAALLALLLASGWAYYALHPSQRPFHHLHESLRPSGVLGLSLGIAGTLSILASLAYVARKRFPAWKRLGPLPAWLGFHVFSGLLGPALALFHAGFVPTSAVGLLAFTAMLVVVLSGVVGRYVLVHVPRTLEGREIELDSLRKRLVVYRRRLIAAGVNPALLKIDAPAASRRRISWLLPALAGVFRGDSESRLALGILRQAVASRGAPPDVRAEDERLLVLAERLCRERQWLVRYREFRALVGAWRFFHRWLAIVLVLAIAAHVAIAVRFGGLWILGGRT
jgi:hypothetical protein